MRAAVQFRNDPPSSAESVHVPPSNDMEPTIAKVMPLCISNNIFILVKQLRAVCGANGDIP